MRHVVLKITAQRWKDTELRTALRKQARATAGRNPGMRVIVKKQSDVNPKVYEVVWQFVNRSGEKLDWE